MSNKCNFGMLVISHESLNKTAKIQIKVILPTQLPKKSFIVLTNIHISTIFALALHQLSLLIAFKVTTTAL